MRASARMMGRAQFRAWMLVLALLPALPARPQGIPAAIGHSSVPAPIAAPAPDGSSIGDWVDRAASSLVARDFAAAKAIAMAALEVDGTNSDLLYVAARASFALDGEVRTAMDEAEASLAADRFARFRRDDAIAFDAALLIRLRRWDDALSLLHTANDLPDADIELYKIRASLGRGDRSASLRGFEFARSLWPSDSRFAKLFFELWRYAPTESSRKIASAFVRRATDGSFDDPALTASAIPFIPDQGDRKTTLMALRAAKGPVATIEALRYGLIDTEKAVDELIAPGGAAVERSDIEALLSLAGPAGVKVLTDRLAIFSGRIAEDADGVPEALTLYRNGQPIEWDLDADQDGTNELVVHFGYGLPSSAVWMASGASFNFAWGAWPTLASATRRASRPIGAELASGQAPGSQLPNPAPAAPEREWRLADGALSWSPLRLHRFPAPDASFMLVDRVDGEAPSERALTVSAATLVLHRVDGDLTIMLRAGIALRGTLGVDGRREAIISYDRGKPLLELLDQDGDGRFESRLHLDPESDPSDPLVLSYESDIDGDGVYEFREELVPPYRRTWDLGTIPATRSGQ